MAASRPLQVTQNDFDQIVLADPMPVVVEFYAPWCGHCRRLAPTIDEVTREFDGRMRVVQVNADENRDLVHRFHLTGVPTIIIFANGQEVDRFVGALPIETIEAHMNEALARVPQR